MPENNVVHIFGMKLTGEFEIRSRAYREHLELAEGTDCGCRTRDGRDGYNLCKEGRRLQREARRTLGWPAQEFRPDPRMTNRLRRALANANEMTERMASDPHSVPGRERILAELQAALKMAGLEFFEALKLRDAEIEACYVVDRELETP